MVRRYEEPIEVRVQPAGPPGQGEQQARAGALDAVERSGAPTAFIWRGRLYAVRDVLGHWHERRAWWREALDVERSAPPFRALPRHRGAESDRHDTSTTLTAPEQLEQEVWRVSASPGRMHGTGVYDLGRDHEWRLLRVAD
jgi:hypothetical protein